jgi:hypothetical protein
MRWTNTYKRLNVVGDILIRGLQDTLRLQKHNATGRLSNSFKKNRKKNSLIMNVITNRKYWKIVNNGKAAFRPNLGEIFKWVNAKGIKGSGIGQMALAKRIAKRIQEKGIPSKPYVVWTEGNNLQRTNFAGVTKEKKHKRVVSEIRSGALEDVFQMVKKSIRVNATNIK